MSLFYYFKKEDDRSDEIIEKDNPSEIVKNYLFFEGQLYDAYSVLLHILNSAKKEIIIIDNYANEKLLDILRNINIKIILVSKNINETLKEKYEGQYSNVTFINNDTIHDRFIIIDQKILYTCGASFKDLGKKCFAISELNDKEYLKKLLKVIFSVDNNNN